MKMVALSDNVHAALMQAADKNFRTPDLQIMYWLSKEDIKVERQLTLPQTIQVTTRKVNKKKATWTPEKRAAQSERIRQYWASGKLKRGKGLDSAAAGRFDD